MALIIDRDVLEQLLDLPEGVTITGLLLDGDKIRADWQVHDSVPDADFLLSEDVEPEYGINPKGAISLLALHSVNRDL